MIEVFETAVNSNMYFLLAWPAIYAFFFCIPVLIFRDGIVEDEEGAIWASFIMSFVGSLASFVGSIAICGGNLAALEVFWTITGLLVAGGLVLPPIVRIIVRVLIWGGRRICSRVLR